MNKRFLLIIIAVAGLNVPNFSYAQKIKQPTTGNTRKQMKRLARIEDQKTKDQQKAERDLIKKHTKLQDKSTRKMMKRSSKKSNRMKKGRKSESFWRNLFRKK